MSKFDEMLSKYEAELKGLGKTSIDAEQLKNIAKGLGPSIYLRDASLVSCSDNTELDRVKNNFAIKKLGLTAGEKLDNAVKAVCEEYNSRNKLRVVFYYLLAQKLGKKV